MIQRLLATIPVFEAKGFRHFIVFHLTSGFRGVNFRPTQCGSAGRVSRADWSFDQSFFAASPEV